MSDIDTPQSEIDFKVDAMRTLARNVTGTWLALQLGEPEKMKAFAQDILQGNLRAFFDQSFERLIKGAGLEMMARAAFQQWLAQDHALPASRAELLMKKIDKMFAHSDVKDAIAGNLAKQRAQVFRMRKTGHTWREIAKSLELTEKQVVAFHKNAVDRIRILREELRLYEPGEH